MSEFDQVGPSPFQQAMKKVAILEAEIERLKFLNKEEQKTIDELSKLLALAAEAIDAHLYPELVTQLRKAAE